MNWEHYKDRLAAGETVKIRPRGNSMQPRINSGDEVTIVPIGDSYEDQDKIKKGDIVFCWVNGHYCVHLVQAVQQKMGGCRYQIGNNKKRTNGVIDITRIFGKATRVEA